MQLATDLQTEFADRGFDIVGTLPLSYLAAHVIDEIDNNLMQQNPSATTGNTHAGGLVLVAASGKSLWSSVAARIEKHSASIVRPENHFSDYTLTQAQEIFESLSCGYQTLYPHNEINISLLDLGRQLGWHTDSMLGLGMHPEFGLWWAYRGLFWVDQPLPLSGSVVPKNYCETCLDQPCIKACPVAAIGKQSPRNQQSNHSNKLPMPDWQTCTTHRLAQDSVCKSNCSARQACPIQPMYRYTDRQMQYHYRQSLHSIKAWYAQQKK